ncbi:hypothetical protein CK203_042162 [Vitis vinifera]|uniref:Uncharacterized protein n=1 Tax=Vitis vinifera TaxID=29760 RepID=A0A438HPZ9_VITVI|nr:hypothetical protein CK203_042162 [Vitis vinifera]
MQQQLSEEEMEQARQWEEVEEEIEEVGLRKTRSQNHAAVPPPPPSPPPLPPPPSQESKMK